jgi:ParB-like chromosome segregation protein Spo0J
MLGKEELGELADDIMQNGLRQPIVLYQGQILDGRNRYQACELAGIEPDCTEYEGDDPLGYVLSLNLHRRHLTASQRAALAAEIANLDLGANQHTEGRKNYRPSTQAEAAEKLDVSDKYVREAKKIQRESPEHFDKVKSGEISLQQAKRELQPEPATSTGDADHAETLPAVKAEPKSDIVVEFAGKRINTLDDLLKAKTPDQKLMDQIYDFNIAVAKASQLVDKLKKHPLSRVMQIMFDHPQLVQTLEWQAGIAKETSLYYRELMDERQKTLITEPASHN